MKTSASLFIMIACGVLLHGMSYADSVRQPPQKLASKAPEKAIRDHASVAGPSPARVQAGRTSLLPAAHQSTIVSAPASHRVIASEKIKPSQPDGSTLRFTLPKSTLPLNAGLRHPAPVGGPNAGTTRDNGVLRGAEIKRHP